MRSEETSTWPRRGNATWRRRAIVGLWVAAYVLGGVSLAARWDVLMTRLARPPLGGAGEGALR